MGHLHHLRKEHGALARRLGQGSSIFLEPKSPEAWQGFREILEILYTPEDAALAARMPLHPEPLRDLAARLHVSAPELEPRLQAMADKGLVMDFNHPDTGEAFYLLSPPVVGFFEFSMMRAHDFVPKRRMALALTAYTRGDEAFYRDLLGGPTAVGRALVHEDTISDEPLPDVLDWQRATGVVETAQAIAVSLCYCRHKAEHLGKACDAPKENCLTLNSGADYVIRHGFGRRVGKREALDILQAGRENGLAHIADNVANSPIFLCSCCGCCCGLFEGMNDFGLPAVNPSGFAPVLEADKCSSCARCAVACPVGAIELSAKRRHGMQETAVLPRVDQDRCIGCGVCAGTCSQEALRMDRGGHPRHVPATRVEHAVRSAIERNRLADLVAEQGTSLGSRFLHLVVKAILNLPVAKRLLADEQLQSRFVRFAVAHNEDPTLWRLPAPLPAGFAVADGHQDVPATRKRAHPRLPLVLSVEYPDDPTAMQDCTENLSAGGMFVRTSRPFRLGERSVVVLRAASLEPVKLRVEVVRLRAAGPQVATGVAMRLPEDLPEDRTTLADFVQAAGAAFGCLPRADHRSPAQG